MKQLPPIMSTLSQCSSLQPNNSKGLSLYEFVRAKPFPSQKIRKYQGLRVDKRLGIHFQPVKSTGRALNVVAKST